MENRKTVANPVSVHEAPVRKKPDDFEPETTSRPLADDRPTSPPPAYDCVSPLPDTPPDSAGK